MKVMLQSFLNTRRDSIAVVKNVYLYTNCRNYRTTKKWQLYGNIVRVIYKICPFVKITERNKNFTNILRVYSYVKKQKKKLGFHCNNFSANYKNKIIQSGYFLYVLSVKVLHI